MSVNDLSDREERPAYVRFEKRAIEDKAASLQAGSVVYKDIDYVLVTPPYSKDCFESKWTQWIKNVEQNVKSGRTPQAWMDHWKQSYEHWKKGEEAPVNGTPVKNWPAITAAQVKTVIASGILTVEDLALANDEGIRRLGMGGRELKNKAMAYVKAAKDTGSVVMENAALKNEIDQLKGTVLSLTDKLKTMEGQLGSMRSQPFVEVDNEISASDILDPIDTYVAHSEPAEKSTEERYIEKFGKKPHHMMKEETILKKLEE